MKTLEALTAMRDLLAEPGAWTQRTTARDKNGATTRPRSGDACSWCLLGAIVAVLPKQSSATPVMECLSSALQAQGRIDGVVDFNDAKGRTQQDIIALLDAAIVNELKAEGFEV